MKLKEIDTLERLVDPLRHLLDLMSQVDEQCDEQEVEQAVEHLVMACVWHKQTIQDAREVFRNVANRRTDIGQAGEHLLVVEAADELAEALTALKAAEGKRHTSEAQEWRPSLAVEAYNRAQLVFRDRI